MNTSINTIVSACKDLQQNLGVISTTTTNNTPQSAVVYFSYDENLNIYFTTRTNSRKYTNLTQNPHVSFVIFNGALSETIQIEGSASFITDPGEQAALFSEVIEIATNYNSQPPVDQLGESEIAFVKITTSWARIGNFEVSRIGDVFEEVTK